MSKKHKQNRNLPRNLPSPQPQSKHVTVQTRAESFSGPLPPPVVLKQYDEIVPGAAERILSMAESQSQHRQQLERSVIESDIKNSRLGLHYGLSGGFCLWKHTKEKRERGSLQSRGDACQGGLSFFHLSISNTSFHSSNIPEFTMPRL